jgi:arylsulfatase
MVTKYRGRYMKGWNVLREERHARLVDMGIIDKRWLCSPEDPAMFSWDELDPSKQEEMDLRMAVYAAQVEIMDQGIGRIVHMLEKIHQLDNTLIFFLSDNGASQEGGVWGRDHGRGDIGTRESSSQYGLPWANLSNTPFRHYKRWIHEGGVATPLIVHWPGGIEAKGELRHQLGHINDIMATCVDVAEVAYPTHHHGQRIIPCEGLSLTPVFASKDRAYPMIGWEHEGNRGVRKGKWKLVALRGEASELYDMTKDRTELHNLADRFPEKVEELEKEYRAWAGRCGIEPWKWPIKRNMMPLPAR